MPNATAEYYQIRKEDWDMLNFALRRIWDRLDALEGKRGSTSHADDINLNNHRLINVRDPVDPQEAATKSYVDKAISELTP